MIKFDQFLLYIVPFLQSMIQSITLYLILIKPYHFIFPFILGLLLYIQQKYLFYLLILLNLRSFKL